MIDWRKGSALTAAAAALVLAVGMSGERQGAPDSGMAGSDMIDAIIPAAEAAPAPPPAPPASFARCAVCHNAAKGAPDKLGPNLWGVYGHKMGQGSFNFSDAVKKSNLKLDDKTLDKWLANPRALVPGNRMSFPGMSDAAKRKEIIDYLKKLH